MLNFLSINNTQCLRLMQVPYKLGWFSFCVYCFFLTNILNGQTIPAGFPLIEDQARISQLLGKKSYRDYSFSSRPIRLDDSFANSLFQSKSLKSTKNLNYKSKTIEIKVLPLLSTLVFNSSRPFGWGNYGIQNGKGISTLISPGVFLKFHFFEIQLRPELAYSQNLEFEGYPSNFSSEINFARFRFWNFGDHPERFYGELNRFAGLGQSYASFSFGKVEIGAGTQNIWWGPGQYSALIFSNNARGIPHLFFKTKSPANIGIGFLEAQIIAGKAKDSKLEPSQNKELNKVFFNEFNGDWRYVNGISLVFQPDLLKGLSLGFNRTFQQYNKNVEKSFLGRFPIFETFLKERLFQNGNSVDYDQRGQDQQVSVFFRMKNEKGRFEIYSEYGRRDHSFNWREFILNPEHARAYLLGFSKLISSGHPDEFYQLKGEIIHQSESVNRHLRYERLGVINTSWHTHYQVRGFSNFGESMGVGVGVGSNAQIFEFSKVKTSSKVGLIFKRIVNHQDFYNQVRTLGFTMRPWIDYSLGLIWDQQFDSFIIGSKLQFVKSQNYQWESGAFTSEDFDNGPRSVALYGQVHLIYNFQNK